MFWRNNLLVLLILTAACRGREDAAMDSPRNHPDSLQGVVASGNSTENATDYAHPLALIEAGELLAFQKNEHVRIIDFREREIFDKGHVPQAIPIWRSDIEDHTHHVEGMMATKPEMEKLFSSLGISAQDTLIVYDDQAGVNAARLWWVLKTYGFNQVRLLNGGFQSWQQQQGPVSSFYETLPAQRFVFPAEDAPHLKIDKDSLHALMKLKHWTLVDARTADEHSGKRLKKGAKSAGRIPGSLNIDWADAVDYHGTKKFRTADQLQTIYKGLPQNKNNPVVVYCHSGVRSAHTSFVLTQLLGYTRVYNYDGSWLEWSASEGAPIEKDSATLILQ
jgi:thiosulfate/3-mercaptopyruvate sulfurtransferase